MLLVLVVTVIMDRLLAMDDEFSEIGEARAKWPLSGVVTAFSAMRA